MYQWTNLIYLYKLTYWHDPVKSFFMTSRDEMILKSAGDLFMRYGIGRTTMADIAQAAGVARQTLYNTYPNKDEVLRAVVRSSVQANLALVKNVWASLPDIGSKMDAYYQHGPIAWFDLVEAAPDASEVIDGLNNVAKTEVAEGMAQWTTLFRELFEAAGVEAADAQADFFVQASKNTKYNVPDRATFLQRLEMLKLATLSAIEQ